MRDDWPVLTLPVIIRRMDAPTIIRDQKPQLSVADLFHMMEHGSIDPEAKFGLVEREICGRVLVACGSTRVLPQRTASDPNTCIYPLDLKAADLSGEQAILVVDIAITARRYDLGPKASLYAGKGAPELWVSYARDRETHVYRGPDEGLWRQVNAVVFDQALTLAAAPGLGSRMSDAG